MSDFKFTRLDLDLDFAWQGQLGEEEGRHVDTANHIRHFDLAGLNPEGTSQIDMKEFTVSHAVGNPCTPKTNGKLSTLVALGFEECGNIKDVGERNI